MEPKNKVPEETVVELCRRIVTEQDVKKLLELTGKLQRLLEPRPPQKKPR